MNANAQCEWALNTTSSSSHMCIYWFNFGACELILWWKIINREIFWLIYIILISSPLPFLHVYHFFLAIQPAVLIIKATPQILSTSSTDVATAFHFFHFLFFSWDIAHLLNNRWQQGYIYMCIFLFFFECYMYCLDLFTNSAQIF